MLLRNSENTLTKFKHLLASPEPSGQFQPNLAQSILTAVKVIRVCTNEGPLPFPKGDNYKIAKHILQI